MTSLPPEDWDLISRLVTRTIGLIETEYPNGIRLQLSVPPTEPITPRSIYPAFYGCYDWHSAVHSHWQIVRALRVVPDASFGSAATAALDCTLTSENVAVEMAWVADRPGFEMPYGMAWLLRLCRELREWDDARARAWLGALGPLERHALDRFEWYCTTMVLPVRGGMHNQTAFSLGLVWDSLDDERAGLRELIAGVVRRFYGDDTEIDLRFEPSAADFLSPSLSEADLMRRVLSPSDFVVWVERFSPNGFGRLRPVEVVDPSDGQLAHWAGLNLSRSWMMTSLVAAFPGDHAFVGALQAGAGEHAAVGLRMSPHDDYMISHWVPTFAIYLLTREQPIS